MKLDDPKKFTRTCVDTNIKNLILSELHSCTAYVERNFHALLDLSRMGHGPKVKQISNEFLEELMEFLEVNLLRANFLRPDDPEATENPVRAIRQKIKAASRIIEGMVQMDFEEKSVLKLTVNFINVMYQYAHK